MSRTTHNAPRPDDGHDSPEADLEALMPGALRAASDDFPSASPDLAARAEVRGRRLRRTRNLRAAIAIGALATVAIGGTVAVARLGDGTGAPASGRQAPAPAAVPTAGSTAEAPEVSADEVMRIFKSVLPEGGSYTEERSAGTAPDAKGMTGPAYAGLIYKNARGTSAVGVDISVPNPTNLSSTAACMPEQVRPHEDCTVEVRPDGTKIARIKGFTYPNSDTGQKWWRVSVLRADGVAVAVETFGGGGEKATTKSVDPVFTLDQLSAIALSPAWDPVAAAVPRPDTGKERTRKDYNGEAILGVLKALLPAGTTVSSPFTQGGYATVVADDGKGKSAIGVNVQAGATPMPCRDTVACTDSTLPDGTKVQVAEVANDKDGNAKVYTAEAIRPDGRRVVVRLVNANSEAVKATRTTPLLTLDQLKALATDPRWDTIPLTDVR
ncbi:MAG: hypothetical protein HOU01_22805 [Streptomycetaceae bacterium]|nr:hypothetical protein [Streptomycetaceae bacterium]